jgi:hypothetical protein
MPGKLTKFHCDVIFEQNTVQEVEKVSPHSQFVQFDKGCRCWPAGRFDLDQMKWLRLPSQPAQLPPICKEPTARNRSRPMTASCRKTDIPDTHRDDEGRIVYG